MDNSPFESLVNACKITTYVGAGVVISIFIIMGFIILLSGDVKGIFLIFFSAIAGVLVYFGTDETCRRNALGLPPRYGNNRGFTINFG